MTCARVSKRLTLDPKAYTLKEWFCSGRLSSCTRACSRLGWLHSEHQSFRRAGLALIDAYIRTGQIKPLAAVRGWNGLLISAWAMLGRLTCIRSSWLPDLGSNGP